MKLFYSIFCLLKLKLHSEIQLKKVKKDKSNTVFGNITIVNPKNLKIGSNCSFNHGVYINACNPIKIGNDVTVSAGVKIISTGIDYNSWILGKKQHTKDQIIIGDHVWIGANSVILEGVTISGKFVIIAAGSIVKKNIDEDYSIYAGVPARKIKSIRE